VYRGWETKPALVAAAVQRLADVQIPVPDTGDAVADHARAPRLPDRRERRRKAVRTAAG
jgi:hypothetical protein